MQYPPIPKHCDKRRKLTDEDKEDIRKMKDDFSTRQLAAKFGKSIDWVDARLADGTFTSRKLGGSVFIDMEDVI